MSSLKRTCWTDATDIGGDVEELVGSRVVVDGVSMESSERLMHSFILTVCLA
jgi:hypothetical protein